MNLGYLYTYTHQQDLYKRDKEHAKQVEEFINNGASSPLSCTTSATASGTQCFKITLEGNTFKNFNYLKQATSEPPVVRDGVGMQHLG